MRSTCGCADLFRIVRNPLLILSENLSLLEGDLASLNLTYKKTCNISQLAYFIQGFASMFSSDNGNILERASTVEVDSMILESYCKRCPEKYRILSPDGIVFHSTFFQFVESSLTSIILAIMVP